MQRATETVDSYRRVTDSMRDTTKWLLTLVPGAGLAVALVALVPDVAGIEGNQARAEGWAWLVVASLFGVVTAFFAAQVLTAGPTGWGDVVDTVADDTRKASVGGPQGRTLTAELDSHGVTRLYGYRSISSLIEALAVDDPSAAASAVAAGTTAADFATMRTVRGRFRTFLIVGGVSTIAAAGSLAMVSTAIADAVKEGVDEPMAVRLAPQGADAHEALGCTPVDGRVDAVAIDGTLSEPKVVIDDVDSGCDPKLLAWKPEWGPVIPVP